MSISISLAGAAKSYGGRAVLEDVTCGFPSGMISAVIGPNGSGKTTLLKAAAGLIRPDAGNVSYADGTGPLADSLALMRRMTYVSQKPVMFNTTLYENIAFGLKARGLPHGEIKTRVDEALQLAELMPLAQAKAIKLSGGEMQRAALVRAYALRPDAVFLDEPAANLDPGGVRFMESLARKMKKGGATVVIVTHNLFQAKRLADHVFFMYEGALVESGPGERFFSAPEHRLTREFLGGEMVY